MQNRNFNFLKVNKQVQILFPHYWSMGKVHHAPILKLACVLYVKSDIENNRVVCVRVFSPSHPTPQPSVWWTCRSLWWIHTISQTHTAIGLFYISSLSHNWAWFRAVASTTWVYAIIAIQSHDTKMWPHILSCHFAHHLLSADVFWPTLPFSHADGKIQHC